MSRSKDSRETLAGRRHSELTSSLDELRLHALCDRQQGYRLARHTELALL